ncbi:MAG: pitrilysin family protein [bacterium]|nr:pitrilysin family protein [bacterium]
MKTIRLTNGLKVVFVPTNGPTLGVSFLGKAGSLYGKPGLAHFLEHTVLCATEKYPDFASLAGSLDNLGLYRNAYTSHENMCFVFRGLPEHLGGICNFLSEVTIRPLLLESDIEKQKKIILQEIRKQQSDPQSVARLASMRQMFGNEGAGMPVLGTEDAVMSVRRDDLVSFFNANFNAENFVLVIAGKIDEEETLDILERTMAQMPKAIKQNTLSKLPVLGANSENIIKDGLKQAILTVSWEAPLAIDKSRYPVYLIRLVMADGRLSRLWQELRQKNAFVYSISSTSFHKESHGKFTISTGLDLPNIDAAASKIIETLESIAKQGITEEELVRAKNLAKIKLIFESESSNLVAEYVANRMLIGDSFESINDEVSRYMDVSLEDVKAAAESLSRSGARVSVLVPLH